MVDQDLEIEGGGGAEGGGLQKTFFPPFGPQFGSKSKGGTGPLGPSPGSATDVSGRSNINILY